MSRYIDADAFKEWYAKNIIHDDAFDRLVDMQPTADVRENVHGEWIFGSTIGHSWMKCSNCLVSQSGQTLCFSYCPNCGAVMYRTVL